MKTAAQRFLREIHTTWDSREPWEASKESLGDYDQDTLRQYCAATGETYSEVEAIVLTGIRAYLADNPPPSRVDQCTSCRRPGVHVDTPAGEIVEHGAVVACAPEGSLYLLVNAAGDLTCDDCERQA